LDNPILILHVFVAEVSHETYSQVLGIYTSYDKAKARIESENEKTVFGLKQESEFKWTCNSQTEFYITEVTVE
jgi:hypothetical protein